MQHQLRAEERNEYHAIIPKPSNENLSEESLTNNSEAQSEGELFYLERDLTPYFKQREESAKLLHYVIGICLILVPLTVAWGGLLSISLIIAGCVFILLNSFFRSRNILLERKIGKKIAEARKRDGVVSVGPLAEILETGYFPRRSPVYELLVTMLPRLTASDAKRISQLQRRSLYRALTASNRRVDKNLKLAILKALEQIGDRGALPYVKRLATWSSDPQLRSAANDCLPFLMADAEMFNRSNTYLRPSSATEIGTETLLRASDTVTSGSDSTPPEELLRATANGTETQRHQI